VQCALRETIPGRVIPVGTLCWLCVYSFAMDVHRLCVERASVCKAGTRQSRLSVAYMALNTEAGK
jgi:hypothetical protein